MEIIVTLLSGILGVSSSIVYEVISTILKRKNINKEDDITSRIKDVSTVLENSVQELGELQTELEERVKMVEKLKEEAEQVKAVRTTLNNELQKEGRKSFWQGVIVNFVFFVSGAIVSYIVSKYLVWNTKYAFLKQYLIYALREKGFYHNGAS